MSDDSRKFKIACKEYGCKEEFISTVENSSSTEQAAADDLCRKLEKHFKEKHPDEGYQDIKVKVGSACATLQENGTIKHSWPISGGTIRCGNCGKFRRVFEDKSIEEHKCKKSSSDSQEENSNLNTNSLEREREQFST